MSQICNLKLVYPLLKCIDPPLLNTFKFHFADRAADGHPAPYNIRVFELGNEQYNPHFVEQVLLYCEDCYMTVAK